MNLTLLLTWMIVLMTAIAGITNGGLYISCFDYDKNKQYQTDSDSIQKKNAVIIIVVILAFVILSAFVGIGFAVTQ